MSLKSNYPDIYCEAIRRATYNADDILFEDAVRNEIRKIRREINESRKRKNR